MRSFVIFMIALFLMNIWGSFLLLSKNKYPRPISRKTDLVGLWFNTAMFAWAAIALQR